MADVFWCEENLQSAGHGEDKFENIDVKDHYNDIYLVITERDENSGGSVEMRLGWCLTALERDDDNDIFDNSVSNMNMIVITILIFI